ncbi:hypothetical protein FRX31_030905 [Thalictrum thalictroides]|uniref:Uncharacterized protein n=1 Tax=Thalictrum thalictroides TaxID=46969 RepID=A0A7J6V3A1_THATH|nr:hypothetical protein FRX31_030905 [Thalictrum thalictroides]
MLSDHKRAERREVIPGRVKIDLFGFACVACNDRSGFTWIVMIAVRGKGSASREWNQWIGGTFQLSFVI